MNRRTILALALFLGACDAGTGKKTTTKPDAAATSSGSGSSTLRASAPVSGGSSATSSVVSTATATSTSDSSSGSSGGSAVVAVTCGAGSVEDHGQCYPRSRSCAATNGTGSQTFSNGTYGACVATACNAGYALSGGQCYAQSRACTVANGSGSQAFDNGAYGACVATACSSGYKLSGGACASSVAKALLRGAIDLGNGHKDLLFQEANGDLNAWVGNGGFDFGAKPNLTFGTRALSAWNPAATTRFLGAYDLGNGHEDLLFQEANGDLYAWIGNGGYDFGDKRALTFGGRPLSSWDPSATTRFIGAYDLGNGHADLLFQQANGDLAAWVGNGGYDFGDYRALTFGGRTLSSWNPSATTRFVGAFDLGNGHADLLFQEANGDLNAWVGNGGFDFGDKRNLTFGGRPLSAWDPSASTRFVGAADLGNGHADLLFQQPNGDVAAWMGNGGYDFGVYADLTFGGRKYSAW